MPRIYARSRLYEFGVLLLVILGGKLLLIHLVQCVLICWTRPISIRSEVDGTPNMSLNPRIDPLRHRGSRPGLGIEYIIFNTSHSSKVKQLSNSVFFSSWEWSVIVFPKISEEAKQCRQILPDPELIQCIRLHEFVKLSICADLSDRYQKKSQFDRWKKNCSSNLYTYRVVSWQRWRKSEKFRICLRISLGCNQLFTFFALSDTKVVLTVSPVNVRAWRVFTLGVPYIKLQQPWGIYTRLTSGFVYIQGLFMNVCKPSSSVKNWERDWKKGQMCFVVLPDPIWG